MPGTSCSGPLLNSLWTIEGCNALRAEVSAPDQSLPISGRAQVDEDSPDIAGRLQHGRHTTQTQPLTEPATFPMGPTNASLRGHSGEVA